MKLRAGTVAIVPRRRWHRLEVDAPGDLMSLTLRHGTRLEKRTDTPPRDAVHAHAHDRG